MTGLLLALTMMASAAQDSVRQLQIEAVAFDRKGNPVADLKREDVEVWISGYRVPVESISAITPASAERPGRLVVLLLDNLTVEPRMVLRVREVARRFVTRMLPEDRMAVVLLDGGLMEITSDQPKLLGRVDSLNQTGGLVPPDHLGVQVLTTISAVTREMSEGPERRKAIVAIGSGWLFDTPIPPPQVGREVRQEWLDAVRALASADVNLYVIDPTGVGSSRAGTGNDGFARDAGGHAFINTNDLTGAVDRILREADNYYVIRVGDPPVGRGAALRELDVRSKRRDVTIRARRAVPGSPK